MKCVNCKYCIGYDEEINGYWCNFFTEFEIVPECIANDDEMYCDMYDEDSDDDFTARS